MAKPKFRISKPYVGRRKNKNLRRKIERVGTEFEGIGRTSENYLSSTAKKFQAFGITEESLSKQSRSTDDCLHDSSDCFFLVQKSCLQSLVEKFHCPNCQTVGHMKFNIMEGNFQGFAPKSEIHCSICNTFHMEHFMSSRLGDSKKAPFEVNIRAVLAFRSIGCGFSSIRDWCSTMNLPNCISREAYSNSHHKIGEASKATFDQILKSSREAIQTAYKDIGIVPDEQGILDIAVSFDGSWQRRGHSSHNGMASVIELLTGLPLDHEVLSNFCRKCKVMEQSDQSEEWKLKHSRNCLKNFEGSANAMEAECAVQMWKRSIDKNNMRYTTMLCDGDSKSYDAISEAQVYGPDVIIKKEDCVNHISKRMGTALRNLVCEAKAKGLSVSGKGKLTQQKILKIQNYYGRAIKDHHDDIPLLRNRIFAILLHLSSSDEFPKHQQCPPDENSWCFWQRALAKNVEPGTHKDHETVPSDVGKSLVPIFQRLSEENLLKRCSRNKTQNSNESLHHLIWKFSPKAIFNGRKTLETAVLLAMCQFSMGKCFKDILCKILGFEPGKYCKAEAIRNSIERLKKAEYKSSEKGRKRRRTLKYNKNVKEQSLQNKEGQTYSAGTFH